MAYKKTRKVMGKKQKIAYYAKKKSNRKKRGK